MFAGFNLKLSENLFGNKFEKYIAIEKELFSRKFEPEIENIINQFEKTNALDGNLILNNWFPKTYFDVFISHSHSDEKLANAFAGWLYEQFKITSFIDSNVWGYIDNLLNILNNKYSHKKITYYGWMYDHECCKKSAQHANIMLLTSLQAMIDITEAVFFINTDKSVSIIDENGLSSTYSPWIYAELLSCDLIRKKSLQEYRRQPFLEHYELNSTNEIRAELKIKYDVSTKNLYELSESDIKNWLIEFKKTQNIIPMDFLYKMFIKEVLNEYN